MHILVVRTSATSLRRVTPLLLFGLLLAVFPVHVQAQVMFYVGGFAEIDTISPSGTASTFATGFPNWFPGLAIDASGNIYASDVINNQIDKFTPGHAQSVFVSGLNGPYGLAFDSSGNLYEMDNGTNTVNKITPGGSITPFATGFVDPWGLTFDSSGNLYVADPVVNQIDKITPGGIQSVSVEVAGATAGEVLSSLTTQFPDLRKNLFTGKPGFRGSCKFLKRWSGRPGT